MPPREQLVHLSHSASTKTSVSDDQRDAGWSEERFCVAISEVVEQSFRAADGVRKVVVKDVVTATQGTVGSVLVEATVFVSAATEEWSERVSLAEIPLQSGTGRFTLKDRDVSVLPLISPVEGVDLGWISPETAQLVLSPSQGPVLHFLVSDGDGVRVSVGGSAPVSALLFMSAMVGGAKASNYLLEAVCERFDPLGPMSARLRHADPALYCRSRATVRGAMVFERLAVRRVATARSLKGQWWIPAHPVFLDQDDAVGRVLVADALHPWTGEILASAGTTITPWLSDDLIASGARCVRCNTDRGVAILQTILRTLDDQNATTTTNARQNLARHWAGQSATHGSVFQFSLPGDAAAAIRLSRAGRSELAQLCRSTRDNSELKLGPEDVADAVAALCRFVAAAEPTRRLAGLPLRELPPVSRVLEVIADACESTATKLLYRSFRRDWSQDADWLRGGCWFGHLIDTAFIEKLGSSCEGQDAPVRAWVERHQRVLEGSPGNPQRTVLRPEHVKECALAIVPFLDERRRNENWVAEITAAYPVCTPELPLVRASADDRNILEASGHLVLARVSARVVRADADAVSLEPTNGLGAAIGSGGLYIPIKAARGATRLTTVVSTGDAVANGSVLACSTSVESGSIAVGVNLRVAYAYVHGVNGHGGALVSQSAASRLSRRDLSYRWFDAVIAESGRVVLRYPKTDTCADGALSYMRAVEAARETGRRHSSRRMVEPEQVLLDAVFREDWKVELPVPAPPDEFVRVRDWLKAVKLSCTNGRQWVAEVAVASARALRVGDELTSRHGGAITVSAIVPDCDMPILPNGDPVDIALPADRPLHPTLSAELLEAWAGEIAHRLGLVIIVGTLSEAEAVPLLCLLERIASLYELAPRLHDELRSEAAALRHLVVAQTLTRIDLASELEERVAQCEEWVVSTIESGQISPSDECISVDPTLTSPATISAYLGRAPMGRTRLRDGRSGEWLDAAVATGILHCIPLRRDELLPRARSSGPIDAGTGHWQVSHTTPEPQSIDELALLALAAAGAKSIVQEFVGLKDSSDAQGSAHCLEQLLRSGTVSLPKTSTSTDEIMLYVISHGLQLATGTTDFPVKTG